MRRRGRGVIGTVAHTAVVAGTATVVSNSISNKQQRGAAPAAEASPNVADQAAQIEQLGALLEKGLLTQEEFDAKKKAILGL